MSNERGSMEPGTIILIACVVGVFVLAFICAFRSNTKRAAMIQDFARSKGWGFSRTDTDGLSAKIDPFFPVESFRLDNIMTIESGGRRILFFDGAYHYRERRRGDMFGTGCLIESARFRSVGSQLEIDSRNRIDGALLPDQVDLPDSEFARLFIVSSKDAAAARRVLTQALQQTLVNHHQSPLFNPVRISLTANGAVVLTGLNAEPERWLDLIELARSIESSLP